MKEKVMNGLEKFSKAMLSPTVVYLGSRPDPCAGRIAYQHKP